MAYSRAGEFATGTLEPGFTSIPQSATALRTALPYAAASIGMAAPVSAGVTMAAPAYPMPVSEGVISAPVRDYTTISQTAVQPGFTSGLPTSSPIIIEQPAYPFPQEVASPVMNIYPASNIIAGTGEVIVNEVVQEVVSPLSPTSPVTSSGMIYRAGTTLAPVITTTSATSYRAPSMTTIDNTLNRDFGEPQMDSTGLSGRMDAADMKRSELLKLAEDLSARLNALEEERTSDEELNAALLQADDQRRELEQKSKLLEDKVKQLEKDKGESRGLGGSSPTQSAVDEIESKRLQLQKQADEINQRVALLETTINSGNQPNAAANLQNIARDLSARVGAIENSVPAGTPGIGGDKSDLTRRAGDLEGRLEIVSQHILSQSSPEIQNELLSRADQLDQRLREIEKLHGGADSGVELQFQTESWKLTMDTVEPEARKLETDFDRVNARLEKLNLGGNVIVEEPQDVISLLEHEQILLGHKRQIDELAPYKGNYTSLEAQNKDYFVELEALRSQLGNTIGMERYEAEKGDLLAQLESHRGRFEAEKGDLLAQLESHRGRLEEKEGLIGQHQLRVAELEARLGQSPQVVREIDQSGLAVLNAEIQNLQNLLREKDAELIALRNEAESAIAAADQENVQAQQDLNQVRVQLQSAEAQIQSLMNQPNESPQEIARLQGVLAQLEGEKRLVSQEKDQFARDHQALNQKHQELLAQHTKFQSFPAKYEELQGLHGNLKAEHAQLRQDNVGTQQQLQGVTGNLAASQQDFAASQQDLAASQREIDRLQQERMIMQEALREAESKGGMVPLVEFEDVQFKLGQTQQNFETEKANVDILQREIVVLKAQIEGLEELRAAPRVQVMQQPQPQVFIEEKVIVQTPVGPVFEDVILPISPGSQPVFGSLNLASQREVASPNSITVVEASPTFGQQVHAPGTVVEYFSVSQNAWIPTTVTGFQGGHYKVDKTPNLIPPNGVRLPTKAMPSIGPGYAIPSQLARGGSISQRPAVLNSTQAQQQSQPRIGPAVTGARVDTGLRVPRVNPAGGQVGQVRSSAAPVPSSITAGTAGTSRIGTTFGSQGASQRPPLRVAQPQVRR
jgi:DNA repair exonuclease SbcCD ATPase subunit